MRSDSRLSPAQVAGGAVAVAILIPLIWLWTNPGIYTKMTVIVYQNPVVLLLLFLDIPWVLWSRYKHPEQFTWIEVPVQVASSWLFLWLASFMFFYYGSDLHDRENWNGYVTQAHHQEGYDERHRHQDCRTDDKGHEDCDPPYYTCDYTPPSWASYTNNDADGAIGIGPNIYQSLVSAFGGERRVGSMGDACDGHPGWTWDTTFNGSADERIPSSISHNYVNYLKASDSILKTGKGSEVGFEKFLLPEPEVHDGEYGPIYLDRVLAAGADMPEAWQVDVDRRLDLALTTLGAAKQANILVYMVGTPDRSFLQALESAWVKGKKNDIVVIVGAPNFPTVAWVEVMAWTRNEDFKIQLRNGIRNMGDLSDSAKFSNTIIDWVSKPPEQGGFERMPMSELTYLAADAKISNVALLLTCIVYAFVSWLVTWALNNNELRDWASRSSRDWRQ